MYVEATELFVTYKNSKGSFCRLKQLLAVIKGGEKD